jgi:tetratricopeptide (TPR) repeat protein
VSGYPLIRSREDYVRLSFFEGLDMTLWNFQNRWSRKSRKDEQETPTSLAESAFALLQKGEYIEARSVIMRALDLQSKLADNLVLLEWLLGSLARTWEETEDYQAGTEFLSDFIRHYPDNIVARRLRAESLWYSGNTLKALAEFSRVIELNPDDGGSFLGRGQVFVENGDFKRALEDLERAMTLVVVSDPHADPAWKNDFEAFARNGCGAAFAGLREFDRASEEFAKSIALCPENAWVYFNVGRAWQAQGDKENAVLNYKVALGKKDPKLTTSKRAFAIAQIAALTP